AENQDSGPQWQQRAPRYPPGASCVREKACRTPGRALGIRSHCRSAPPSPVLATRDRQSAGFETTAVSTSGERAMARYELKDADYGFNASLDPFAVLKRMGFTEQSIYQEGNIIRIHCPIHKDLVRKSMIIDASERTFKCQYSQCEAYEGGLLIELVAMYYDCPIEEVTRNLFGEEDQSSDLLFRGEMYINKGQHQEALPFLEQAVAQEPRNEITRAKLAALYLELNRKDDAYREYMNAAESYAVRGELEKTLS